MEPSNPKPSQLVLGLSQTPWPRWFVVLLVQAEGMSGCHLRSASMGWNMGCSPRRDSHHVVSLPAKHFAAAWEAAVAGGSLDR